MAIDDIANRRHDCDLLLDQNVLSGTDSGYLDLIPRHCRLLLGPHYAMLRPEFAKARANLSQRDGDLKRIFVFFGGSDPTNETTKAIEGLLQLDRPNLIIDVVVGSANPHREQVCKLCESSPNLTYHCQVDNMAELMAKADVSIGAGGSASWERCCLSLPAIVTVLADNQEAIAASLANIGALCNLGRSSNLSPSDYSAAITGLTQPDLRHMARMAGALVDGQGTQRLVAELTVNP
jgi:UDP-2,4-diacetamido-2,4,6-trideoxy-beta-L-altropyranose hydrolase